MPQLTLTFPSGRSPMDLERIAGDLEREYGCEVTRGEGVPLTRIEQLVVATALETLEVASRRDGTVPSDTMRLLHALRDRVRSELR